MVSPSEENGLVATSCTSCLFKTFAEDGDPTHECVVSDTTGSGDCDSCLATGEECRPIRRGFKRHVHLMLQARQPFLMFGNDHGLPEEFVNASRELLELGPELVFVYRKAMKRDLTRADMKKLNGKLDPILATLERTDPRECCESPAVLLRNRRERRLNAVKAWQKVKKNIERRHMLFTVAEELTLKLKHSIKASHTG